MNYSRFTSTLLIALTQVLTSSQDLPKLADQQPGPAGDHGLFKEPWEIWAKQPISPPVLISATARASSGTQVSISLAGQTYNISGVDCSSDSPTNRFYP